MNNKISVIMSIFNESKEYIDLSIESILNQTYTNFELILIYDNPGNLDLWYYIKRKYSALDNVILKCNHTNLGLAKSLNYAFSLSTGNYIARMDADDISLPNRLEKQIEYFFNDSNLMLLSTNCFYINELGEITGSTSYQTDNITFIQSSFNILIHPSWLMRRSTFFKLNGYRSFPVSQDYDFSLRMISNNLKIEICEEKLLKYRVHSTSISTAKSLYQMLVADYIRSLFKERKVNNTLKDSFSEDELVSLLQKSEKNSRKYNNGKNRYVYGLNKKNFYYIFTSVFFSKYNYILIRDLIKRKIYKVLKLF